MLSVHNVVSAMRPGSPKLSAPAFHDRLIEAPFLEQMGDVSALSAHWLCAGAGAGKTQGTRLWLAKTDRPYAWIQLDPLDNDPLAFLAHLHQALEPLLAPSTNLPHFNPLGGWSLSRHCEFLWEVALANLKQPSILVLDDAHLIVRWAEHPVLDHLMHTADPRLHLVVLSRTEIPDEYTRDVINRRIRLIEPSAFVWQEPELRAWLKKRWNISRPKPEFVSSLLHLSQGGAAVLALLDIDALSQDSGSVAKRAAEQLELGALMEQSLLEQLSRSEREMLRWLARLGSFPESWLSDLGFPELVVRCVQQWRSGTSVIARLERAKDELRFHPLFAEVLCKGELVPLPELASLRERVIGAAVERGRLIDAIELCRDTGHWSRYWDLVQRAGLLWIERGQVGLLQRALGSLPPAVQRGFQGPTLSLFLAASSLHEDPTLALEHSMNAISQAGEDPLQRPIWAIAVATAANAVVASGVSLSHLRPIIDEVDAALQSKWFKTLPAKLRLLVLGAGMVTAMLGETRPSMTELFAQLQEAMKACDSVEIEATTLSAMMRVVVLHGLTEFIEPICQQLTGLEHRVKTPEARLALMHAKTNLHLTRGELALCLESANATLAMQRDSSSIWAVEVIAAAAFASSSIRALDQTKQHAQQLARISRHSNAALLSVHLHSELYSGCSSAHAGNLEKARNDIERSRDTADTLGYPLMQVACRSGLAVIELELGNNDAARSAIEESQTILQGCDIPLAERIDLSTQAYFAYRTQPPQQATPVIAKLLQNIARSDAYVLVMSILPTYEHFLSFALEHEIERETVFSIIRRAPLFPPKRPHPFWPSLFEVQTLGRFELRINGECARHRFISNGRRYELLTALFWHAGRKLSHQYCFDRIWPYIDRARQPRTMRAALRRLLTDFGREDAILDDGKSLSLNPELWSFDAWDMHTRLQNPEHDTTSDLRALKRGFYGPTPIPDTMRNEVPSQGGVALGPKTLLPWLDHPRD